MAKPLRTLLFITILMAFIQPRPDQMAKPFRTLLFLTILMTYLVTNALTCSSQPDTDLKQLAYKLSQNLACFKKVKGGLSGVDRETIVRFIHFCENAKNTTKIEKEWTPSIRKLQKLIEGDPILRLHWEAGIQKSQNTLKNYSSSDVLNIMDSAMKLGPMFTTNQLVGFPLSSILIEFMQTEDGRAFFSSEKVNKAFKRILDDYGKMLQSKESLRYMNSQPGGWFSQEAKKAINYDIYECDPQLPYYGFKNWNEWFLREFKEGKRPVGAGTPPKMQSKNVIVNPCESTPLSDLIQPYKNAKITDKFWLKDTGYSLFDMFGGKKLKKTHLAMHFEGGTVYQAYLSALNYHRWHSPIDGVVQDIYNIEGTYLLDQSQFLDVFDPGSATLSQPFLTTVATRQVFVIKSSNKRIGKVAIIFIGMAQVSSCVATVKIGQKLKKGQEIGHFAFGGSSYVMVFEKKAKLHFSENLYQLDKEGTLKGREQLINSFLAYVQ